VVCILWILSAHDFAIERFSDYNLNVIEHVSKVLDYYNKEKIVRIIMMLFESLMKDKECMDHLSMINALNIVTKLSNRVWVDKNIEATLDRLWKEFDSNYQEFSTFDKWKKQVSANNFSWSTVHTEKFWQSQFVNFHQSENLELIKTEISFLKANDHKNDNASCVKKAVICFDLGEFARYFPNGRNYLGGEGAKEVIAMIMGNKNVTPELKKEAITAYQKILMTSWGQ